MFVGFVFIVGVVVCCCSVLVFVFGFVCCFCFCCGSGSDSNSIVCCSGFLLGAPVCAVAVTQLVILTSISFVRELLQLQLSLTLP